MKKKYGTKLRQKASEMTKRAGRAPVRIQINAIQILEGAHPAHRFDEDSEEKS